MPVAVNCSVVPGAMAAVDGEIAIELSVAPVTFKSAVAVKDSKDAVMVTLPPCNPVASPVPLIAASLESDVLQVADELSVSVVPLL
jgi:hypothetical protein